MANTILITANWHTGALSQQTISRQYDNNRYAVQFVGYPEASEGNELDYYLLVWMSSAPGEMPDEIAPIRLASDQWYISNFFTQQTQQIKFQMCALNTAGTFEAHSPIFTGFVRNSLEHDGTTQDIDVSTLFDAYREYLNELIIAAGAVIIDPTPTQGSTNAVQSGGVKSALDGVGDEITDLKADLNEITVYSNDYTLLEPLKTVSGIYVFNNAYNNKLYQATDTSMAYKVYAIEAGQKYGIHGFGYDRYQFYMAVLGDNSEVMEGTTPVSNFIENVLCGTDVYPSGYTYHTVTKTFESNGYLFVNYKVAQSEATCSAAQKMAKVDTAITESVDVRGIEKRGNEYYHFSKLGDEYLIRRFTNMGGNNLFQWAGIALGKLTPSGVSITQTIINYDTDIIGPITIFNTALFPNQYGEWTGGNHTKTVDGTAYPTAEQESLKILVNGEEITEDGVYYGDVKFVSVNSLYFPQSITGADLSTATKAITETREYNINKQLDVRVRLNFVETTRCQLYYGMQAVIVPYNNILFANNEYYGALPNASNINFSNKEHEVIMTANDGMRLIASLRDIGLGTFNHNDGSTGYATLPASSVTRKLYYRLIDGRSSQGFENGNVVMWEGSYIVDTI